MSNYFNCDGCDTTTYTETNPYVEVRVPRPSDPSDLCCIIAGCSDCFGGIGETVKTPQGWSEYMESDEAYDKGYMWLS